MTTQSSSGNPFYSGSSSAQRNGATPMGSSMSRMALDNLIRRELKVGDPNDAQQIAQALLTRYKDTPRAAAITREAQGVPFLLAAATPAPVQQATTSSDSELQQAVSDVERDLQELTTDAILKDLKPELQGWAAAIRSAIQEGANAARFAIDTRKRDITFGIRRTLGDYARMARLVGALTPQMNTNFRKFAESLDEVASVLLVMMGESIANIGFNGGRFLLQVPYSELQQRRDAAIYALRNLTGSTQEAYDTNTWPRGIDAYRRLYSFLETQGQGDLRALLVETELVRVLDNLIQRTGQGTPEGLRQLGATAQLDIERLRRMVIVGQQAMRPGPDSPPLTTFLESLQLFVDGFSTSGGFRLLRIARPPLLFYGLYGTSTFDSTDLNLLRLVIQRGLLADQLDCFLQCGCNSDTVKCQIVLDKILYDVDRAIDLYAVGLDPFGQPERRASAYSYLVEYFVQQVQIAMNSLGLNLSNLPISLTAASGNLAITLSNSSPNPSHPNQGIVQLLRPSFSRGDLQDVDISIVRSALINFGETSYTSLNSVPPSQVSPSLYTQIVNLKGILQTANNILKTTPDPITLPNASFVVNYFTPVFSLAQQGQVLLQQANLSNIPITNTPPILLTFLGSLQQELLIQRDMEDRWRTLVETMAPDCVPYGDVFNVTKAVINGALATVSGAADTSFDFATLPPNYEALLNTIANEIPSLGNGGSF